MNVAKTKKSDRINEFVMVRAQARCEAKVRAYLSSHEMGLTGVADFGKSMDAIIKAMTQMYSDAMCDTLDVVDGRPLTEIAP
jgi:hypothetical protein